VPTLLVQVVLDGDIGNMAGMFIFTSRFRDHARNMSLKKRQECGPCQISTLQWSSANDTRRFQVVGQYHRPIEPMLRPLLKLHLLDIDPHKQAQSFVGGVQTKGR
jgi:hypothetical protein